MWNASSSYIKRYQQRYLFDENDTEFLARVATDSTRCSCLGSGLRSKVLKSPRFLDLSNIGTKNLTLKMVFIAVIAPGRRRIEIHALFFGAAQFSDNLAALKFLPSFRPKALKPDEIPSPIFLPALHVDPALCPVKILSTYPTRRANYFFLDKTGHSYGIWYSKRRS